MFKTFLDSSIQALLSDVFLIKDNHVIWFLHTFANSKISGHPNLTEPPPFQQKKNKKRKRKGKKEKEKEKKFKNQVIWYIAIILTMQRK